MATTTQRYQHLPLPRLPQGTKDLYIHFIKLFPGEPSGPITCALFQILLSEAPEFEALSYCWGEPMSEILVCDEGAGKDGEGDEGRIGKPLEVPASLIPSLYRTRSKLFNGERKERV